MIRFFSSPLSEPAATFSPFYLKIGMNQGGQFNLVLIKALTVF